MQICPKKHQICPKSTKFNANLSKKAQNLMQILYHCRKLMQIRCKKGAGSKLHKCLVAILEMCHILSYSYQLKNKIRALLEKSLFEILK